MNDNVENLVLERLRGIDDRLHDMGADMKDNKLRMTATDEHLLSIQTSVFALSLRMDRFDERLERVERRMDIKDVS